MPDINYSFFFSQDSAGPEGLYLSSNSPVPPGTLEILTYSPGIPAAEWGLKRVDTSAHYWVVNSGTGDVITFDQSVTPWKVGLSAQLAGGSSKGILGQIWFLRAANPFIQVISWILMEALATGLQIPAQPVGLLPVTDLTQNIGKTTFVEMISLAGAFPNPAITSVSYYADLGYVNYTVYANNFGQQPGPFRCTIAGQNPQDSGQALFIGETQLPTDGNIVFNGLIDQALVKPETNALFTIEDANQKVVAMYLQYID